MPVWSRARWLLALALVPALLFGPLIAAGEVFLPYLPVGLEPLAGEHPEAAAEALREGNWAMGDRVFPFLTDQVAARRELAHGALPTWEPLQALGMPLLGGTIGGLTYPPNALSLLAPPEEAAAPLALLSLVLAGLGMALMLLRLGLDPRAVLIGALGYQLGGWGLANLFYYMKVDAALWLPWALWAVEGWVRGKRWSASALVGALTMSALAGMATITVFVFGTTLAYGVVRVATAEPAARSRRTLAIGLACFLGLGLAGGALQLLPLSDTGKASLRHEMTREQGFAMAIPVATALGTVVPDLVGRPTDPTSDGNLPVAWMLTPKSRAVQGELANVLEWNTYALAAVVLLAVAGAIARPRQAAFPGILLVACFAFTQAWPGFTWAYALPGLDLGAPGRVLGLAWALWPWLAAIGVDALLARAPRALPAWLGASLVASLAALAAWRAVEPSTFPEQLEATLSERFGAPVEEVRARMPRETVAAAGRTLADSLSRTFAATLALFACGAAALFFDRARPRFDGGPGRAALVVGASVPLLLAMAPALTGEQSAGRGPLVLLALSATAAIAALTRTGASAGSSVTQDLWLWFPAAAVLLVEGFLGARPHIEGRSLSGLPLFPPSPTIALVHQAAGDGRVIRLDQGPEGRLIEAQRLARPNLLVPYGIAELTPYPTFTPRQLPELFQRLDPRSSQRNHVSHLPDLALVDHPLLDLVRVTCVLSVTPLQHSRLVPVLERPDFCIYRRLGALPAARIVPAAIASSSDEEVVSALLAPTVDFAAATRIAPEDSAALAPFAAPAGWTAGTITAVERPAKERVLVRVQGSHGGWLVLHEQWAEGWKARIGERDVPVLRADHAYRCVAIPEGDFEVEFRYAPRSLEWGAAVTLAALLATLVWELLNKS